MTAFQSCTYTGDLMPLYLPQQLYLKPIARINISLQLPNVKKLGKSVSHWEIMDKIRGLIKPEEFTILKVTKTTVEFVRFEGELESRNKLDRVISKIDNKMIKLKDFNDLMRLRAAESKTDFPNRRVWDDFFSNAKDMDEMKPGERPDTVHISNAPTKWFVPCQISRDDDISPSEKILYRVFEKFGSIRNVDIPICDPYRKKMKEHISGIKHSSFDKTDFFEGYVQFKDYIGFTKTMDALRDMKLVCKDDEGPKEVNIKVDFDRTKHLSDASIRRREIVRDRLVKKAREKEEKEKAELGEKKKKEELEKQKQLDVKAQKEQRRKLREEKRKAKILEKLEIAGTDEINEKIANEEKKLLKVQRKLEAIRLVEELFNRIKEKDPGNVQLYDNLPNLAHNELQRFKNTSELEVLTQREKLHHAIKGRVMLKTILADNGKPRRYSSSSSSTDLSLDDPVERARPRTPVIEKYPELLFDPAWLRYQYQVPLGLPGPLYPEYADMYNPMRDFVPRSRGFPRIPMFPRAQRGTYNRRRGNYRPRNRGGGRNRHQYHPDVDYEYLTNEHDDRGRRSGSPHTSRDSRSRSHTRRRSRSRSHSSSRSRSRSRKRRRSRSRSSRSRSRGRRRSYTRERSRSRSSRYTPKRSSRSKSREKSRTRGRSKSEEDKSGKKRAKSKSVERSKSRERSVDSSTFMTPKQLQEQMAQTNS